MRNRSKLALSAALMVVTVPLAASSCQEYFEAFHFDITTMGIVPGTAVESPKDTFRLPAGPANRTLRITVESRVKPPGAPAVKKQPEFCTLDLGGRMDISFTPAEGDTFVGEVKTPTSFGVGKSAPGTLTCQFGALPQKDVFTVVVVK